MAHQKRGFGLATARGLARGLAGLTATLMLGACAQSTSDLLPMQIADKQQKSEDDKSAVPQNELQKATTYWGQEYAKKPSDLKSALNYARNLRALGEKQKALEVMQHASSFHDGDKELAGEYGRLALDLDQVNVAARMLELADDPAKPDWKVISARGTVLAKQGQYKQAIPYYERALSLSPNQPSVLNNLAMAHAMGGDPKQAEELLRQASATPNVDGAKMKQNLALVLGLQGRYDEAKSLSAGSPTALAAAQNVDMVRNIVKLDPKAAPVAPASALAKAPANFKTQVSEAIATAPGASAAAPAASPVRTIATLRPATVDTTPVSAAGWQSEVVAGVAAPDFKGSAR